MQELSCGWVHLLIGVRACDVGGISNAKRMLPKFIVESGLMFGAERNKCRECAIANRPPRCAVARGPRTLNRGQQGRPPLPCSGREAKRAQCHSQPSQPNRSPSTRGGVHYCTFNDNRVKILLSCSHSICYIYAPADG